MCDRIGCDKPEVVITLSDGKAVCTDHAIAIFAPGGPMGHSVPRGKSLIEKIRDDLDEAYKEWKEHDCKGQPAWCGENNTGVAYACDIRNDALVDGIAHALGVLRGTSADSEWEEAKERYEVRQSKDDNSSESVRERSTTDLR
jgi:hypothetical protein